MDPVTLGMAKADAKKRYPAIIDTAVLRHLTTIATAERATALATSRVNWEDTASIVERWTDLTAWTPTAASNLQISGGNVYANGAGGNSGATRPWALGTTGVGRAVFVIRRVIGASGSGGLGVGVSTSAAAPTAGAATARALYVAAGGVNTVQSIDNGTFTTIGTGSISAGTHVVTVVADPTYLSITLRKNDGSLEYRARWARAGFSIQSLYIFNSDANALTGGYIGPLAARQAIATSTSRAGIEDQFPGAHWTASGAANIRVATPTTYDSRRPLPVLMAFHGNGSNALHFADNANGYGVANAFLAAGYLVVSADNNANVSTWGAQAGLDAYYLAYKYVRDNYPIGPLVLYGNSMGGMEALLSLAERRLPGIAALILTVPATNLAENYANALFTATITTAYGISGDYAAKTAGHDPTLLPMTAYRGVPIWALYASDDASVTPAANWQTFAPLITPYSPEVVTTVVTGGHSTASIASNAAAMVTFADKYTKSA